MKTIRIFKTVIGEVLTEYKIYIRSIIIILFSENIQNLAESIDEPTQHINIFYKCLK